MERIHDDQFVAFEKKDKIACNTGFKVMIVMHFFFVLRVFPKTCSYVLVSMTRNSEACR